MGDKSSGEGPPPPSPLTGAYLLIVLPQTHQLQHKDYVVHNLTKGLLTWDKTDCHVDLEKELQTITAQAPEGEEAKNGERLIQFASENLVTEVLIHPQLNTLVQCMRNLLSSFTRHRHIIHAGYTCAGNGAWMLQDGTYSYADFAEMYQEHEVQRVLRAYENTVSVDVHCLQEGDWNNLKGKDPFSKVSRVRLNPKDCVTSTPAIKGFLDYLSPYVTNGSIDELLESSDVVGNIRFSHPTLYVFPGGQGDAALFGINGFNMLVDGGFARKACFWDFSRHLDRLDAVLMTRLNNGNIQGMTSLLQRKRMDHVYPQIGHFFCNMQERRHPLSPDGDKDRDPLLVNLFDQGQDMLGSLRHLQLKPQPCYRDPVLEPVNLYHKVGHGKLDMYVISPAKDSREVREFMAKWTTQDTKIFCSFTKRGGEFNFPLCNKVSICVLLVWQPANPEDNITRLLFPGSTPQHKIFEGLDKLKNLEFMKHAVCTARTLSPSSSSVGLNVKTISKPKVPASVDKMIENDEKKIEAVKQPIMKPPIGQMEKQPPKSQPPSRPPSKQKPAEKPKEKPKTEVEVKTEKTETAKTEKAKPDKIEKTEAVQKIDKPKEKPKRPITKQPEKKKPAGGEKKDSLKSSPTTPKKITENKVPEAQPKPEVKSRASSRTKPSPSATPAKSAKEANNRKVLEQKKEATKKAPPPKKEEAKKAERSIAPRKSVPSPSKADKQQVSPVKAPRPVIKPKQEGKKTAKPEKEVVTESVASTPSTVDVELAKTKEDLAEKETRAEEIKVGGAAETAEQPSLSKDEEDEILVIEKIEIEGDGKGKPEESIAVHIRNSREDIIADEEAVKDEANADLPSDEKKEIMKTSDITIPDTDSKQFSEDVQDITKDAPDTSKSRVEFMTTEEASITKEPATDKLTPKEKDGKEKSTDIGDIKQTDESQPDEKFSTTVESGATTAPTLPEDERIPLDEIKEIIEEKYIKEETKEKDIGVTHRPEQPTSLPEVPVISSTPFDQRVQLLKDIVKTPDEVADLPVHEEADGGIFGVDETQLARDFHKSRDDLLGIPAPRKPIEKKEDTAEEVKLVKDENEKEDATKDLKEDDIVDEKAALSADAHFGITDQVDLEEHKTPQPDALSQKPDDNKQSPEKKVVGLIDDEALKSSAIPTSLDDEEILDEDKDKETEKEKLLPKESRDLDKDEDVADKADKEMLNEKQVAKSVVQEEIKGQKPIPEAVPLEELHLKTEVVQDSNKAASDQAGLDDELTNLKDTTKVVHKSKSPSPEPEAKSAILLDEKEALPSPELTGEEVKGDEAIVKSSKSPSPDSKIEETKDSETVVKASKSPSPELKKEEGEELEAVIKQAKSPSPQPENEKSKGETVTEAPKSPSPEPKAEEPKDVGSIVKASKSPSPEPKDEKAKDVIEAVTKSPSPEPKNIEFGDTEASTKTSKSPSPEPKIKAAKETEAVTKPSSPDPKSEEAKDDELTAKALKSPSPGPQVEEAKDGERIAKASKSPSPEIKDAGDIEAFTKTSKTPSPEPAIKDATGIQAVAKSSSPDLKIEDAKDDEAIAKASKSPSPEPKMEGAKDSETITKSSKSPSPEPKLDDAKDGESTAKVSKSPSPEPKMEGAKDSETITKSSKSPSPEPKLDDAKDGESTAKVSKSPSPEPKMEGAKDSETVTKSPSPEPKLDDAKDGESTAKASKSPSPEPKMEGAKDSETITKSSKLPSPVPKMDTTKDGGVVAKASKSPSPEPSSESKMDDAKDGEAIAKASKSPSPEPKMENAMGSETNTKASISPSPEPMTDDAKTSEMIVKASKSPSPEPKMEDPKSVEMVAKASKSPSPEPKMEDPKSVESTAKASKSPSPEPKMEGAKDSETVTKSSKSPSPEPKKEDTTYGETTAKSSKTPSPEPKLDDARETDVSAKAAISSSPEPKAEVGKAVDAIIKSPSPEPKTQEAKAVDAIAKVSKSPSPEPKTEEVKEIHADVKSSKPSSPELKITEETKDIDSFVKASKSPSPEPKDGKIKDDEALIPLSLPKDEEAMDIDALIKSTASPSPVQKTKESKDVEVITKATKSPSPEPKADQTKLESLDKSSKSTSPDLKPEAAEDLDAFIKDHKSPSPAPKDEGAKDTETTIKTSKSPSPDQLAGAKTVEPSAMSPEPSADMTKDIDDLIKASTLPSPDPKLDDGKTKDSELAEPVGKPSSVPPSPEPKGEDSQEKLLKSPSPEPKVVSIGKLEESDDVSKSLEPEVEQVDEPRSPSTLLKEVESSPLKAQTMLSKSPTPEPKVDEVEIEGSQDKEPMSHSPEQKSDDSKLKELSPQLSKSPTPEPSTETLEVAKSAAPKPETSAISSFVEPSDATSLVPEDKISKSPSPEPTAEVSKGSELTGKASKSPSPEPLKPNEMNVEASSSPEPKIAASPLTEIEKFDGPQTKVSKSPSPEPMTKMAKSPEPVIKDSKSPESVADADQKVVSPPPESLSDKDKPADSLTEATKTCEPTAKSPEPSVGDQQPPLSRSDEIKGVMEKLEAQSEDSKLIEPSTEVSKSPSPEPIKSLEPQTQVSKSPSPEPTVNEQLEQPIQKEVISKVVEHHETISDSIPQKILVKDSSVLDSLPDTSSISPSPEPQANDVKSTSPFPLQSVDGKSDFKATVADDISSDIKDDALAKKVKTKEELNQELVEEKEIDEVSEPQKKDLKNLQTKLDGEASSKTSSGTDSSGEPKAESSKLEAEKHEKEINLEQESSAKHGDSAKKEKVSPSLETIGEKEIDQSLAKKSEESKEDDKLSVESKLAASDPSSGGFKMDDRVPSISLREASIEQTSEESALHKQAEIDKAPGDLERDITSTPGDRKPSSGDVSPKSTDADAKTISDEGKSGEVSPKGTIEVEGKAGVVEEVLSKIESSPLPGKHDIQTTEAGSSHVESYEEKVGRLEKSIADDREMLRELIKANEESKISTQLQLDKSQSSAQDKLDGTESTKEAKVEESIEQSLPESIKLEADKDSVEVKSKDESKDEALVLDFDLPEKQPREMSESDSKETVSKISETSFVSDYKPVSDELGGIKESTDKTSVDASQQKVQTSLVASETTKTDSYSKDLTADSTQEQSKSESDKVGIDVKPETKVADHDDKLLTKTPSPTPVFEGKDDKMPDSTKPAESPEKSPLMDKKMDILAKVDQEMRSSTPELPTKEPSTDVVASSDVTVLECTEVEDVTVEKKAELTSASAKGSDTDSSKADSMMEGLPLVTSNESKSDKPVESDTAAGIESYEISHTSAIDSLHEKEMKQSEVTSSTEEKMVSKMEQLEEIKETSKEVIGSVAGVAEQLQFATSAVDLKPTLESIEPLVVEESKSATVTAQSITEKDVGGITTAMITKTEEQTPATKNLDDESTVVKSSKEHIVSTKDSLAHSTDSLTLLTNGKTPSDIIHETEGKKIEDTAGEKEHGAKKSDIRVTDILDTAERIVSSLNGKKTISDEPSDYIPSFSETKSYSLTIEGKKGPSDEITVETKTIEEGVHSDSYSGAEGASCVSKYADASIQEAVKKPSETTSTITSQDMNGHSKLYKEEDCKMDTTTTSSAINLSLRDNVGLSSALTEAQENISERTTSSGGKGDSTTSKSDKSETEKLGEPSESVSQSISKTISETATTIGETVSSIGSFLPSDLLKSSTSSAKGSTTASPDLSRKSDDASSTTQRDAAKGILGSKLDLASKESLIDATSSFLSMESGVSQSSEKSIDTTVSSSKSGEKVTETTDKKSSLSSTQVEPPTEKDQPILHSATAALRMQKDFSRSETPASDILSDRDVEIGHCTPYSDTSSGQVSRAVTHVWETVEGRPESRHYDSDEDMPGSPMSISSHIPSPPQFEYDMSRSQDPMMMSSFYGALPGDLEEGVKAISGEMASAYDYGVHDKGDISLKKELGGDKLSASIRSSLTSTPESSPLPERRFESLLATSGKETPPPQQAVQQTSSVLPSSSSTSPIPDPIGKWDKPLGLPPPHSTDSSTPYLRWNPYKEWGKPLGLPSPAPPPREDTDVEVDTSGSAKTTPKKVSKMNAENNKYSSNAKEASNKSKRSESPVKKPSGKDSRKSGPTPVYMDLSYVPHHGNSNYATVEFFKRVRARYYVFSGTEPSKEVFNALLEAKQSWEDKDLEVTIIPTYDTDTLGYWIAENEETLSKLKIDLSPSASRCTINLQDHDTSCSAYRLEF